MYNKLELELMSQMIGTDHWVDTGFPIPIYWSEFWIKASDAKKIEDPIDLGMFVEIHMGDSKTLVQLVSISKPNIDGDIKITVGPATKPTITLNRARQHIFRPE